MDPKQSDVSISAIFPYYKQYIYILIFN